MQSISIRVEQRQIYPTSNYFGDVYYKSEERATQYYLIFGPPMLQHRFTQKFYSCKIYDDDWFVKKKIYQQFSNQNLDPQHTQNDRRKERYGAITLSILQCTSTTCSSNKHLHECVFSRSLFFRHSQLCHCHLSDLSLAASHKSALTQVYCIIWCVSVIVI